MLALSLALLLALPAIAMAAPTVNAEELPVEQPEKWRNVWYKFETPLITLIFPADGKKPMFLWWYTNDNSTVYVVKFQGVIEYLIFNKRYYLRRFRADRLTINATMWKNYIEPKMHGAKHYKSAVQKFFGLLHGLHGAFLPFNACEWNLTTPQLVENEDSSYWSFNFTLTDVHGHPRLDFAENNIQIRCRFYVTKATETPDASHPDYNYTVAAGHLKFDFVVSSWEWNIDKINDFLKNHGIGELSTNRTGLALWINMASITIEDLPSEDNVQIQNQFMERVETKSQMRGAFIEGKYYRADLNETKNGVDEKPVAALQQLKGHLRHVRIQFARRKTTFAGFLEFVPWARLLNETGTVEYVDVTASYIAAGHHLRLFLCYPHFGNYTLEHDPTIGLASAPTIPTLISPITLAILIGTTVAIAIAIAAVKIRKRTVNIVNVQ